MRDGSSIQVVRGTRSGPMVRWEMDAYTAREVGRILNVEAYGGPGASTYRISHPDTGWLDDSEALIKAADEIDEKGDEG